MLFNKAILMNIKLKAYIFITLALIGGALFPIALKVAANNSVNIYAFLFLAFLIATPSSLILVVATRKTKSLKGYVRNPKIYITLGLIGFANLAFTDYILIYSEHFVSASLATVIYRTQPLLMLLFIPVILRERVSKIQIAALMLAFSGIYIALTGGNLFITGGGSTMIILLIAAMTLISAAAAIFLKRYTTDMASTMFIFNSTALVISAALFAYTGAQLPALNTNSTIALIYMGVIMSVFVPFLYYSAFRVLKTTFVTNFYFLSPFVTILFAGVLLGEPIYLYYLVVAALVAVGIFIQTFDKKGGLYVAKNRHLHNAPQIFDVTSAFINNYAEGFYQQVRGGGRALAMKLENGTIYENDMHTQIFERRNCMAFTNMEPHPDSKPEEIEFINDVMGTKGGGTVLIAVGDPKNIESAFEEFVSVATSRKTLTS